MGFLLKDGEVDRLPREGLPVQMNVRETGKKQAVKRPLGNCYLYCCTARVDR